jgi:hypothetical protein
MSGRHTFDSVLFVEAHEDGKIGGRDVRVGVGDELEGTLPELSQEGLHEEDGAWAPVVALAALIDLGVLLVPHVLANAPDGIQFGIDFLHFLGDTPPQKAGIVNLVLNKVRK